MSKNELVTTNSYTALEGFNLTEALSEEMVGLSVTFDRVVVPAAGVTVFEVPGELPGETDAVKDFTGVILFHHPLYSYYRERYSGGKNPPDCGSYDGEIGIGDPGGACARCPLNKFGSGENGGKACKNKRRVFVLREGEMIPLVLTLPTGSINEFGVYIKRLLSKGRKPLSVVTRFSLKKALNVKKVEFSQAQFAVDRVLSETELPLILAMAEQVKQFATRVGYEEEAASTAIIDPETGEVTGEEPAVRPLN